jgi:hypothetical protein
MFISSQNKPSRFAAAFGDDYTPHEAFASRLCDEISLTHVLTPDHPHQARGDRENSSPFAADPN